MPSVSVVSCPNAVQTVVVVVPVQLIFDSTTGFAGGLVIVAVDQVVPPSVLTAMKGASGLGVSLPAAAQIAVDPVPLQLTEFKTAAEGAPAMVGIVHVPPPSVVTASRGALEDRSWPTTTHLAVPVPSIQLTPRNMPVAGAPAINAAAQVLPPFVD